MKKIITGAVLAASPLIMFAQGQDALGILGILRRLLNAIIPILVTAAIAYFIFGVVRYVIAGDADKKEEARSVIVRGVIGLFFILTIWGVVVMLQNTLGLKNMQVTDQNLPRVLDTTSGY